MCPTEQIGEIVDNLMRKDRIFILHQPTRHEHHQHEMDCNLMTQLEALPVSPMRYAEEETTPGWWFHRFDPIWTPFIQRLCRQRNVTLFEIERAASQVPGLTPIEKTIAMSAFRLQQEQGLLPSHRTTAFRSERSLSAV